VTARGSELLDDPAYQLRTGRRSIEELVFETQRLPLECPHLMEWLDFDPLDVFHRRDKASDAIDIRGIVGLSGYKRESNPHGLG
jgi:hypothetical protein